MEPDAPGSYATVVVDPPWRYGDARVLRWSTARWGRDTRPEANLRYPTMPVGEIAALPVGGWAAPDAHLYLWVTTPKLLDALPILGAWGFEYRTTLTWLKTGTLGLGAYFRGDTEHVLFAVRGDPPEIPPHLRVRNWFQAPKTGHSRKPDRFYEIVERVSPGPRLEVFARRRRYGWDAVGNEAPEFAASQAHLDLVPPC